MSDSVAAPAKSKECSPCHRSATTFQVPTIDGMASTPSILRARRRYLTLPGSAEQPSIGLTNRVLGSGSMEFGASIFFTDYSITPAELAVALEERGFDSAWAAQQSH